MAKSKKKKGNPGLLLLAAVGLAIVGGLTYYVVNLPKRGPSSNSDAPIAINQNASKPSKGEDVKVLTPSYKDGELTFKESTQAATSGESREVFAVNAFLKEAGIVPAGARAVSVNVKDGLAEVTFSKEFETTYGTEDEQTLVNGILKTLGQFKSIDKATFRVGDHALDTLGSIDLTEPQPVLR